MEKTTRTFRYVLQAPNAGWEFFSSPIAYLSPKDMLIMLEDGHLGALSAAVTRIEELVDDRWVTVTLPQLVNVPSL